MNHPVKVIWFRTWLIPFVNSQRFAVDPSPINWCFIHLKTNKPFTTFTAFSVTNRIFDKFPFLLCFNKATAWTKPLFIYQETKKKKKTTYKYVVFALSIINNKKGAGGGRGGKNEVCEHGSRIELLVWTFWSLKKTTASFREAKDYNRTRDLIEGDRHNHSYINQQGHYLFIYPCFYSFFFFLFHLSSAVLSKAERLKKHYLSEGDLGYLDFI